MMLAISRNKDPKASAPYLSLLKLPQPPFSDHPGEAFFYADPERAHYLDMLQHLAQYSDELLLVSGEAGSGKSALLERFIARAEEHWRTCRLDGGERLEADRLFSRIAACFQLDLGASDNLLGELQAQLGALQAQQLPVLLIDDAQALSDDALEIVMHLAMLEGEHGKLIRVLLFAEHGLEQRLTAERFAAMPSPHRLELRGLDEQQSAAYLQHRLQAAGYQGSALFSSRELRQLQRDSGGLPGRLNQAAHELLLEKSSQQKSGGGTRRYLQMGLAASAIIGTVLGLHERINGLIGGQPRTMTVSAAERPVVRLADAGNPWAVVIRKGESIQINCGAPADATVGVRPLVTASADISQQMPMGKPLMRDVSPLVEGVPEEAKAAEPEVAAKAEPEETTVEPQLDEKPEPEEAAAEPQVGGKQEPIQLAANEPGQTPLVVKPQSKPDETAQQAADEPAELKLTGVEPSPVPGSTGARSVLLRGSGFLAGSKVAVSREGKVEVLSTEQVSFVDSGQLEITITPGIQRSNWAIQVSTPDNRRSNVLRFQITPPPKEKQAPAAQPVEVAEAPVEKPVERVAEAPTKPVEPPAAEEQKTVEVPAAKAAGSKAEPPAGIKGYDWLAGQPASNYTLQLLASESRSNVEAFSREKTLPQPLAYFAMERNGKTLHALTQGSYADRIGAQQAAEKLPAGIKPWIRSLQSVQQVMKRPLPQSSGKNAAPEGGGVKDTAWVWSQDPNRYTVQLAAASNEQAIEAAMRRISLPGELVVVQTLRDSKPWYALVYGSFTDKAAARGTIERLPSSMKQAGPWPRSFASLQDEISRSTPAQ